MCRVYDVSRDGYNAWLRRGKSLRRYEDHFIYDIIYRIWRASGKLYGSPKITEAMKAEGYSIGKKRVARIMRENGLKARVATLYKATPGLEAFAVSIPNRQLKVLADEPNRIWVGDITYLKVNEEWRFLAVIMDKCSRRIVSWALGPMRDAKLTLKALNYAIKERKPGGGLIFHSDRGLEYRAYVYSKRLAQRGITQSMNRPRRMNDNAHMESFFHNFKAERVHGRTFTCEDKLRGVINKYVSFYNNRRLHSSIGYLTPVEYERRIA